MLAGARAPAGTDGGSSSDGGSVDGSGCVAAAAAPLVARGRRDCTCSVAATPASAVACGWRTCVALASVLDVHALFVSSLCSLSGTATRPLCTLKAVGYPAARVRVCVARHSSRPEGRERHMEPLVSAPNCTPKAGADLAAALLWLAFTPELPWPILLGEVRRPAHPLCTDADSFVHSALAHSYAKARLLGASVRKSAWRKRHQERVSSPRKRRAAPSGARTPRPATTRTRRRGGGGCGRRTTAGRKGRRGTLPSSSSSAASASISFCWVGRGRGGGDGGGLR